jgi:phosphoglycolate phosphatase-like HAD superfamily hydrolase
MSNYFPQILVLDFDGVICDGLMEYFQTTQKTYHSIWKDAFSLEKLAPRFYQLRPVIETGWEMPILLRALVNGISDEEILHDWSTIAQEIVQSENLNPQEVANGLDSIRDRWIASDLEGWLKLHRFYPGVIEKLAQLLSSSTQTYIVTTKEGRFVRQLLEQQGIEFPDRCVIGKEIKQPKYKTLQQLIATHATEPAKVWFVEDRLDALVLVQQQPDLQGVSLYLAAWGYNTQPMRDSILDNPTIHLLSLEQFNQDFRVWIR